MYEFENVTWNAMFYFSFLSHFYLFAFDVFPRVEKFEF